MRLALVGGTGKEGRGLAVRWARAGHDVCIGSRDAERAVDRASQLSHRAGVSISGAGNPEAVRGAEGVVFCVPFSAHAETLRGLVDPVADKAVIIDITVPLRPPVTRVHLPECTSAARQARDLLGPEAPLVTTLHHVSSTHLADPDHRIECDVLACSDHPEAMKHALALLADLGVNGLDAGPLENSIALESLTPVLLGLNQRYGGRGAGIRLTGLPD